MSQPGRPPKLPSARRSPVEMYYASFARVGESERTLRMREVIDTRLHKAHRRIRSAAGALGVEVVCVIGDFHNLGALAITSAGVSAGFAVMNMVIASMNTDALIRSGEALPFEQLVALPTPPGAE